MNEKTVEKQETLTSLVASEGFRRALTSALPKHITPERFCRAVYSALNRTPKLSACSITSVRVCLFKCAELGLIPDGRLAHLIPFNNKKLGIVECQLIVDYKGLVELSMRSGLVSNIHADVVCDNDEFEYNCGEVRKHVIDFKKERGNLYAVYCIVRFKDGGVKSDAMSVFDVDRVRGRSKSKDDGPWVTDWDEMAKKTVFRRLAKWIPISPEYRDALEADDDQLAESRFAAAKPVFDDAPAALPAPQSGDEFFAPIQEREKETVTP